MLLIFDLDGTLIDSREDIRTAVNLTRSRYNLPQLPIEIVSDYIGDGLRKLLERALEDVEADIDEAIRTYVGFYMQHLHDKTMPYPGVPDGLRALHHARHKLAILSNKPSQQCRALLDHFGISCLFAEIVGGDDHTLLKPNAESLLAIMRRTGFSPTDTWMIGDSKNDIETARRAGARSAFVTYGIGRPGDEPPDESFDTFDELVRFMIGAFHE